MGAVEHRRAVQVDAACECQSLHLVDSEGVAKLEGQREDFDTEERRSCTAAKELRDQWDLDAARATMASAER